MSRNEKSEIKSDKTEEEISLKIIKAKIKKEIHKEILLTAKMIRHIMKIVDNLKKYEPNSVTNSVDHTYLKILNMVTQVESNLSKQREDETISLLLEVNEISETDEEASRRRIKENLKESLGLLNALLISLETNKDKVSALGDLDPSNGSIGETLLATMGLTCDLHVKFDLEKVFIRNSRVFEIERLNSLPSGNDLEKLISEVVDGQT
jgi:hypothetical protein